jgi:cytochrome c oxidase subunit IV
MRAFIALGLFLALVLAGQVALVCVAMGMKWDRLSLKRPIGITTAVALLLGVFRLLLQ